MLQTLAVSDGARLAVSVTGHGPPMVFLHGWTSSHREWLYYATAMADLCRCYSWDARGHGRSALALATPPTRERMALDLHELISHYQLERPLLLGHSMGALTIWEYLCQHGCGNVAGLVLVDQSPRLMTDDDWKLGLYGDFDVERSEALLKAMGEDFAESVLRLGAEGLNLRSRAGYQRNTEGWRMLREYLRTLDSGPLIACWASLVLSDYRELLPQIDVPTLLIFGARSEFYTIDTARYVRDRMPLARLELYSDGDHSPQLWRRERFLGDLRRFVQELGDSHPSPGAR